jgi:hypothetical protein
VAGVRRLPEIGSSANPKQVFVAESLLALPFSQRSPHGAGLGLQERGDPLFQRVDSKGDLGYGSSEASDKRLSRTGFQ